MFSVRKNHERGHANHGWLDTYHTFSFAHYYDPRHMGFSALRVINEDTVEAGAGFPTHGHRNMEIISYILEGKLEHKDSMGNISTIGRSDMQVISAGTGIRHSEYNPSKSEKMRFLQIWIEPNEEAVTPRYQHLHIADDNIHNAWRLIATQHDLEGSAKIHQDANVYATRLAKDHTLTQPLDENRTGWLHIATGNIELNGFTLTEGDGVAVQKENEITIKAISDSELILFDLP